MMISKSKLSASKTINILKYFLPALILIRSASFQEFHVNVLLITTIQDMCNVQNISEAYLALFQDIDFNNKELQGTYFIVQN